MAAPSVSDHPVSTVRHRCIDPWTDRLRQAPADPLHELLRATALGDQIAFAELYRDQRQAMRDSQPDVTSRRGASDALQEAYVRIWTQSARYDVEKGQPIVRLVCIDMLRRSASQPMSGPDLETIEEAVPPDDFTSSISPLPEAARSGAVQGDPDGFPLWLVACRACPKRLPSPSGR